MNSDWPDIERIKELIVSYLTGEIREDETEILAAWISERAENRETFETMLKTWAFSGTGNLLEKNLIEKAWKKLGRKVGFPDTNLQTDSEHILLSKKLILKKILPIAASILIFLLAGTLLLVNRNTGISSSHQPYQIITPNGTRTEILLTDGTRVWLNAGSSLNYAADYNIHSREIELSGEAFFQVKTNKNRPFIVKTSGLKIIARGTSFNVKAYPEENSVVTTLVEGKLTVEGESKEKGHFSYTLKPKQNIVFLKNSPPKEKEPSAGLPPEEKNSKPLPPLAPETNFKDITLNEQVNTLIYTSWKDKRWVIERESLSNLILTLERRYNVRIKFKSEELRNFTFTGIIQNETFEQVLRILQLTAPIQYELVPGEATITTDTARLNNFHSLMNQNLP